MQAMEITPSGLRETTLPIPSPAAGEVLMRVAYSGVNRADVMQLAGNYPPPVGASPLPGLEVSGTISAIGESVTGWQLGDSVCALLSGGGYAEFATAPALQCLPIPNGLSLAQAATLPEAAATSVMALLNEANLKAGERVLIHGGTSGVGILIAQIARGLGAEVIATVGSDEKCALLQSLGITAINHRTAPFAQQIVGGVDVIVDILGGPQFATHLKLLNKNGRLVSLAMLEGSLVESVKLAPMLLNHLQIRGATLRSRTPIEKTMIIQQVREIIWPMIESGGVKPFIDRTYPLKQAEKALGRMQERLHIGKILLEVP
jgi:putative PIG3 family NAD(P)H quinone oxidoreductase